MKSLDYATECLYEHVNKSTNILLNNCVMDLRYGYEKIHYVKNDYCSD